MQRLCLLPKRIVARVSLFVSFQFRDLGLVKAVLLLKLNDHVLTRLTSGARKDLAGLRVDDSEKWAATQVPALAKPIQTVRGRL